MSAVEDYIRGTVAKTSGWKNLTGEMGMEGHELGMDIPKGTDTSKMSGHQLKSLYGWESITISLFSNTISDPTPIDLFDPVHEPGVSQPTGVVWFLDPGNPLQYAIVTAARDTYVATRNQVITRAMTCKMVRMVVGNPVTDFGQPFQYYRKDSFGNNEGYIFIPDEDFSPYQYQLNRTDIPMEPTHNVPNMGLLKEDTGFSYTLLPGSSVRFILFIDKHTSPGANLKEHGHHGHHGHHALPK